MKDSLIVAAPRGMGKSAFIDNPLCERITGVSAPHCDFKSYRPEIGSFALNWTMWKTDPKTQGVSWNLDRVKSLVILGADYESYQKFISLKGRGLVRSRYTLKKWYRIWTDYFEELGLTPIYVLTRFEKRKQDRSYSVTTRERFFETVVGSIKVL